MTLDANGKVVSGNIPYAEYICKVLEKMLQEEKNKKDPWRQAFSADWRLLKLGDSQYTERKKVADEYRAKLAQCLHDQTDFRLETIRESALIKGYLQNRPAE